MPAKLNMKYRDFSDETSTVGYRGVTMTAANFDAQVALQDALIAATDAVVLGELASYTRVANEVAGSPDLPSNQYAQRELKWLVTYADVVTTQRYTLELPCSNLTLLLGNTDLMDISAGAGLSYVGALEGYQKSTNGNAISVVEVRVVGRNL